MSKLEMENKMAESPRDRIPESAVEAYLTQACESRGWLCYKTSSPGTNGFPDRTIITKTGMVVFCEVKRPNETPRKLQLIILRKLKKNNANVCVTDCYASVDTLIKALERDKMPRRIDKTTFVVK